ncbi:hypothetical protein [Streptomyces lycii]|uniref:Uncharacterized protein n=1 Tax=Streptomyces lycii TaxID=2654337 RepID=A0ABQ7FBD5_9ACTN|nr:hypothetical protein [Streptomyces lycii]KAF4405910.1 hypothetical protein GCU69_27755 [Streptomyces lycii]PGH49205.1 hypothetical protein CRI70_19015 [Streptomyces sp. Ru87]
MSRIQQRTVQDHVALAEIELCGELMIAASATVEERLSPDRIDEVLRAAGEQPPRLYPSLWFRRD